MPQNPVSFVEFGLHCLRAPAGDAIVVFVHGILSSGEGAWGQPPWPELLKAEQQLEETGIFIFTYQTTMTSGTYSIADVSDALREHFTIAGLWEMRRVAFVCHSMGGIVVRRFLVANQVKLIDSQPRIGLFMVASPSLGSRDANLISVLSYVLQHVQAATLRFSPANTSLDELHRDFRTLLNSGRLRISGRELTEDRPISLKRRLGLSRQVVEPFAAAQYFHQPGHEPFRVPGSDHSTIVKPLNRDGIQHLLLKRFLLEFIRPNPEYLAPTDELATAHAYKTVEALQQNIQGVVSRPRALGALQEALFQTRRYLERRRAGESRDPATEVRLSETWIDVGNVLQPHEPALASLCWIKGHGWADEKVWNDPRFKDLPIRLNDLLESLHEAMQKHAVDVTESRKAIEAIQRNLDAFEDIRPAVANLVGQPSRRGPHSATQRIVDAGNAVEFVGYGESKKITIDDLAALPREDRLAIAASENAMRRLMRDWRRVVRKGRLSKRDNEELLAISAHMADRLELIFQVVETAMGGQLEDHYAAQRAVADHARSRYRALRNAPSIA